MLLNKVQPECQPLLNVYLEASKQPFIAIDKILSTVLTHLVTKNVSTGLRRTITSQK